jgi:hypothetical protein
MRGALPVYGPLNLDGARNELGPLTIYGALAVPVAR